MKKQSLGITPTERKELKLGILEAKGTRKNTGKHSKFITRKKRAQKLNKILSRIYEAVYYFALICGAVTTANLIVNLILS